MDAVKEFSIRAIDGSKTTIDGFQRLGMNAGEMAEKFATGGETARDAFYDVIQALGEMEEPVSQNIAGVDLFGTMWEDLGPEVITQLADIQNGYDKTKAAMEEINDVKYDDIGSALKGIKRSVETELLIPLSEEAMPTFNEFAQTAKESVKEVAQAYEKNGFQEFSKALGKEIATGTTEIAKLSPTFVQAGVELVKGFVEGIKENAPLLLDAAGEMVPELAEGLGEIVPVLSPITKAISLLGNNMKVTVPVAASLTTALLGMRAAKSVITTIEGLTTSFTAARIAARLFGTGMSTSLTAGQAAVGLVTRQLGTATTATTLFQSALTALGGPVGIAAAAIGVLAAGVVAYSMATDDAWKAEQEARKERKKLIESIEEEKEAIADIKKTREESLNEAAKEINTVESQIETLEGLIDANGKVKEGQEGRAKVLADDINKVLPDAISLNEEEGKTYLKIADNIKEVIKQKKIEVAVDAAMEARNAHLEKREELTKNLTNVTKEYEQTQKRIEDLEAKKEKDGLFLSVNELNDINEELTQSNQKLEELGQSLNDAQESFRENEQEIVEQTQILEEAAAGNTEAIEKAYGERIGIQKKYGGEEVELARQQYEERKTAYESALKAMNGVETDYVEGLKNAMKDSFTILQEAEAEAKQMSQETGQAMAEAQVSGIEAGTPSIVQATDDMVQSVVNEVNKSQEAMEQSGINAVLGFWRGLQNKEAKGLVGIASKALGNAAVASLNKALDEHSPSKETEESGQYFDEGLAIGIETSKNVVLNAVTGVGEDTLELLEEMSRNALEKAKEKATSYKELGELYSDNYLSGLEEQFDKAEEWISEGIEKEIEAFEKAKKEELEAYEKAMEKETEIKLEKIEAQIEALNDKKTKANAKQIEAEKKQLKKQQEQIKQANQEELKRIKESQEEQIKANNEKWKAIQEANKNAIEKMKDSTISELEEYIDAVTEKFQKQYDEIENRQKSLQSKFADYGELFEIDEEGNVVINDISKNTQELEEYYHALKNLKEEGASESFLEELMSYGIDDAIKFLDKFNSMSKTKRQEHLADWENSQKMQQKMAEEFVREDYEALEKQADIEYQKMADYIAQLSAQVTDGMFSEIFEDMPQEYATALQMVLAKVQSKLNDETEGMTANIDIAINPQQIEQTEKAVKDIPEQAKTSMAAVGETLEAEKPNIERKVEEISKESVEVMAEYEGDFRSIGNDYMNAFAAGMEEKYDYVVNTASQIAQAAKRELEKAVKFSKGKEDTVSTASLLEGADKKQTLMRLLENTDNARLNGMISSMEKAVTAHQNYIGRFAPMTTNNQQYQDNRVTKEGDIRFTVNTQQFHENDINKMMERANFERRKRNIAVGRK